MSNKPTDDAQTLAAQIVAGKRRAIARGLTQAERGGVSAELLTEAIYPHTGTSHRVGITGPPGAGKSSLVNAIAKELRAQGKTVAILAVDPSSPFTGGALLGDRIRMSALYGDKGVFIRSMASRGRLGGLAYTTQALVNVFDAGGFDAILIETVGAGQAEVDIAKLAHTTIVVEAPGLGDDIQSIKAGILEIADILVLNKADRAGAKQAKRALQTMLQLGQQVRMTHHGTVMDVDSAESTHTDWQVHVLETVAIDENGLGIHELVNQIQQHLNYLRAGDGYAQREQQRSLAEIETHIAALIQQQWQQASSSRQKQQLVKRVSNREQTPLSAARSILQQMATS